jgi:hypothetical protein
VSRSTTGRRDIDVRLRDVILRAVARQLHDYLMYVDRSSFVNVYVLTSRMTMQYKLHVCVVAYFYFR